MNNIIKSLIFSVQSLVNDTTLVWGALSLPVYEPLHSEKLEKLCEITMACLYCSVCVATASSVLGILSNVMSKGNTGTTSGSGTSNNMSKTNLTEEEGLETLAVSIVEKSLEIFNLISNTIKNSTRAGGNVSLFLYFINLHIKLKFFFLFAK